MSDYVLRTTAASGMIRAFFASTKDTVNVAMNYHKTTAVVGAALGRLLTAGSIMGLMLKNEDDVITLSIKGSGEVRGILVTADSKGNVKGYASNPHADAKNKPSGKLNVSGVVGQGTLTVIKDMGSADLTEPYVGTIALKSGEIAEDIAYYFAQSEQIPSVVSLGVLVGTDYSVKQAGGFLIQLMPGASDELAKSLENRVSGLKSLTTLYEEGHTPESLAEFIFADLGYNVLERIPVKFHCDCSRKKVEKALISIGKEELEELIKKDKMATVKCHFCNKEYTLGEPDLINLIN